MPPAAMIAGMAIAGAASSAYSAKKQGDAAKAANKAMEKGGTTTIVDPYTQMGISPDQRYTLGQNALGATNYGLERMMAMAGGNFKGAPPPPGMLTGLTAPNGMSSFAPMQFKGGEAINTPGGIDPMAPSSRQATMGPGGPPVGGMQPPSGGGVGNLRTMMSGGGEVPLESLLKNLARQRLKEA